MQTAKTGQFLTDLQIFINTMNLKILLVIQCHQRYHYDRQSGIALVLKRFSMKRFQSRPLSTKIVWDQENETGAVLEDS